MLDTVARPKWLSGTRNLSAIPVSRAICRRTAVRSGPVAGSSSQTISKGLTTALVDNCTLLIPLVRTVPKVALRSP